MIRIPSQAEQQRRELGRQREFWKRELRRLENHGRALRIEHEHESLDKGWAGPRKWKELGPQCSEFVRGQLEPVVKQIRAVKMELDRLSREIEELVEEEKIPLGLGKLTVSLLEGEVCDWGRFKKRKAVGSYTGCCPSEHSSGGIQRFGRNRPAWEQTCACAVGGSGMAVVEVAAWLACPAKISGKAQAWKIVKEENGGSTGPAIGHRPVAMANRAARPRPNWAGL